MANAVMEQIEKAEREADSIRAEASKEARDIVKAVEEALSAQIRQEVKANAEATANKLEAAKALIGDEIKSLEVRRSAERETMRKSAQARVASAGQAIFERVVADGHH
ncbi:MAG: hypothetical protein RR739_00595 [Clostridia bacterium]